MIQSAKPISSAEFFISSVCTPISTANARVLSCRVSACAIASYTSGAGTKRPERAARQGDEPVALLPVRRLHIDDKTIFNVSLEHTGKGGFDILATDRFNIGGNIVLAAEVQHLLRFLNAANRRTADA